MKIPLKNKDGTDSKRYRVYYTCQSCKKLSDDVQVDHIRPVGESPNWPFKQGELEEWVKALFCDKSNLQILCVTCHKQKCALEKSTGAYKKEKL